MEIRTKFNPGQHVWTMKNNKPTEIRISSVEIHASPYLDEKLGISIRTSYRETFVEPYTESDLFASKEELLKSL